MSSPGGLPIEEGVVGGAGAAYGGDPSRPHKAD